MSVHSFLKSKGYHTFEGNCQELPCQIIDLIKLVTDPGILRVMEIGFNAGHSAELFLESNPQITLTSFDLSLHEYVQSAKEYIDKVYPNRHTLVLGDSRETIPKYIQDHPGEKFDLIFIDGGHTYEIAKSDLENCRHLAHSNTIVIMDDTTFIGRSINGPTKTWIEYLKSQKIIELGNKEYSFERGMVWGKYVL